MLHRQVFSHLCAVMEVLWYHGDNRKKWICLITASNCLFLHTLCVSWNSFSFTCHVVTGLITFGVVVNSGQTVGTEDMGSSCRSVINCVGPWVRCLTLLDPSFLIYKNGGDNGYIPHDSGEKIKWKNGCENVLWTALYPVGENLVSYEILWIEFYVLFLMCEEMHQGIRTSGGQKVWPPTDRCF